MFPRHCLSGFPGLVTDTMLTDGHDRISRTSFPHQPEHVVSVSWKQRKQQSQLPVVINTVIQDTLLSQVLRKAIRIKQFNN